MKKRLFLLTAAALLLLSSCGEGGQTDSSAPSPSSSLSETSSVQQTTEETVFAWGEAEVGMTYDAVTQALGDGQPQQMDGRTYLWYVYEEVPGMKPGSRTNVTFVFNAEKTLEEIQYLVNPEDEVAYEDMKAVYQELYGTPAVLEEDGAESAVWKFQNGYLEVLEIQNDEPVCAVTFYAAACYEKDFPEKAAAAA